MNEQLTALRLLCESDKLQFVDIRCPVQQVSDKLFSDKLFSDKLKFVGLSATLVCEILYQSGKALNTHTWGRVASHSLVTRRKKFLIPLRP